MDLIQHYGEDNLANALLFCFFLSFPARAKHPQLTIHSWLRGDFLFNYKNVLSLLLYDFKFHSVLPYQVVF